MRRQRNAKIIATLGPGSTSEEKIEALFHAGADVFRLNFSHGAHSEHKERLETIRRIEKKYNRPIGIIGDMQGPKLRLGNFENGKIKITEGQKLRLDLNIELGNEKCAHLPHKEIFEALEPGMDLLLDDGKVRLQVDACGKDFAETTVVAGTDLSDHKGVNVPSALLELSALTPKDRDDLDYALKIGCDWIALSFVQRPEDVAEARKIIAGRAGVLVKLEKPQAIDKLEEIIDLADAVMVARGDLGVELPPEYVPGVQKKIIGMARHAGKPVVVATQMLDSMVTAPTPTRAEASDVATAIYDGADAVMLSAETAVGKYAVESVEMMNRIIERVEVDPLYLKYLHAEERHLKATSEDAISAAASQVALTIDAKAIVTFTSTGSTTVRAARERPNVAIIGLTPKGPTARRLALVWGVHPVKTKDVTNFAGMVQKAIAMAKREEFAVPGERLVITAGVPFGTPGATNILRIAWVD